MLPTLEDIQLEFSLSALSAKVLRLRMQSWRDYSLAAVRRFLTPTLRDLPDPFRLKDMERATDRILVALEAKHKIAIYGDYDVDGTCAAALLRRFFRSLGLEPVLYQPDRIQEGYGLNLNAVKKLKALGVDLLITVDCGISNASEIKAAKDMGLDVIVCDHHQVPPSMPDAVAVLNQKREDDTSGVHTLCGAGMAFYLAMAVRSRLREKSWFGKKQEPDLKQLLDLVALASVADIVPLQDETRILTAIGLQKMRAIPVVGIRALCERAGVDITTLDAYHLGFVLGPRINASGRLDSARHALDLLSTDDPKEASLLADMLEDFNRTRIDLTHQTFAEASAQAKAWLLSCPKEPAAIVVCSDTWHEGVIGIVASRIQEEFGRPALLVTFETPTGVGKGSARAGGSKVHLAHALQDCAAYLIKFGGHQAAAGLSINRENFAEFTQKFLEAVDRQLVDEAPRSRELVFDLEMQSLEELNESIVGELLRFGPFGMGNPEPVLLAKALELREMRVLKEKHLKLSVSNPGSAPWAGFWPNGAGGDWSVGDAVDIVFSPQISQFRGKKSLEMRIRGVQK